jgi:hypothetical protein
LVINQRFLDQNGYSSIGFAIFLVTVGRCGAKHFSAVVAKRRPFPLVFVSSVVGNSAVKMGVVQKFTGVVFVS